MKKQIIVTSAILMGFVLLTVGQAWAERERPRNRGDGQHVRDRGEGRHMRGRGDGPAFRDRRHHRSERTSRPGHARQWRGRDRHHDRPGPNWAPGRRHNVGKHRDHRWHHRKAHGGPKHHWRHHRKKHRRHNWHPRRHHRPQHHRRWYRQHHARPPVFEKYIYHHYEEADFALAPADQLEIAASIMDPAGVSFFFSLSGSNTD